MTNINLPTAAELEAKVLKTRYAYFTLPTLDIQIKYRKPDLLKLSFNHTLPQILADNIIKAYKAQVAGDDAEAVIADAKGLQITDEVVAELAPKGYLLLKELCVSLKILDVPQSDFSNEILAWVDIPENDALAFLMHLIGQAQVSETATGGEVTLEDVNSFPDGKRGSKRRASGHGR